MLDNNELVMNKGTSNSGRFQKIDVLPLEKMEKCGLSMLQHYFGIKIETLEQISIYTTGKTFIPGSNPGVASRLKETAFRSLFSCYNYGVLVILNNPKGRCSRNDRNSNLSSSRW